MALIAPQAISKAGSTITFAAATSGPGDTFVPNARGILIVKNGSGASITATVVVPGSDERGVLIPDVSWVIAAGAEAMMGPFPQAVADPVTGLITITYTAVTTVTVAYVSLGG